LALRMEQLVLPKRPHTFTRIHAITYQKTVTVIAVRRSNPIKITFICSFLHTPSLFYALVAFMRRWA